MIQDRVNSSPSRMPSARIRPSRRTLLRCCCGRRCCDEDGDEHDVVDAQHDLHRREAEQADQVLGGEQIVHGRRPRGLDSTAGELVAAFVLGDAGVARHLDEGQVGEARPACSRSRATSSWLALAFQPMAEHADGVGGVGVDAHRAGRGRAPACSASSRPRSMAVSSAMLLVPSAQVLAAAPGAGRRPAPPPRCPWGPGCRCRRRRSRRG